MERDPPLSEGKKPGEAYRWRRATQDGHGGSVEHLTSAQASYRAEVRLDGSLKGGEEALWEA